MKRRVRRTVENHVEGSTLSRHQGREGFRYDAGVILPVPDPSLCRDMKAGVQRLAIWSTRRPPLNPEADKGGPVIDLLYDLRVERECDGIANDNEYASSNHGGGVVAGWMAEREGVRAREGRANDRVRFLGSGDAGKG